MQLVLVQWLYMKLKHRPFVAVSAGTGTACVYFDGKKFNHLGGISVGGGTYQGLLKHLIMTKDEDDIEKLAASGDRKQLDLLIGDVVNEIGYTSSRGYCIKLC